MIYEGHPYRFPAQPEATYSFARGETHVEVHEIYGGHGTKVRVWTVADYRRYVHRLAPQDLVVSRRIR